jgi:hypothetical protein
MNTNLSLKEAIQKIFESENESNSVTEDFLIENGISPDSLIGDAEIQLAKEAMEEEEWLKKLIYDSIIAKAANNLELHSNLNEELVEYCDVAENQNLFNRYTQLLETYGKN